jgi:N6-L-threonylcarbamoyladenine synthase
MITLGIETSCDETALSLIETRMVNGVFECRIIDSLVHSQAELHSAYGGVYPSLAKREHGKNLVPLMRKLLIDSVSALTDISNRDVLRSAEKPQLAGSKFKDTLESFRAEIATQNPDLFESFEHADFLEAVPPIDRVAVTEGPGLEPALWVGINFARILGTLWQVPVIPVNHMEGHIVGSLLESDTANGSWQRLKPIDFPAIALLISGGHTELVRIDGINYTILGQTKDDAVGEAFDKVARLLGLPYPGGPHISRLSYEAHEENIDSPVKLPRPMIRSGNLDFSFSGLKTAVLYAVRANAEANGGLSDSFKKGLAREFEQAVMETLDSKLRAAIESVGARTIIVGGGVSANTALRACFEKTAGEFEIPLYLPSRHISGDNALMIALAGAMDSTEHIASTNLKAHGTKRLGSHAL